MKTLHLIIWYIIVQFCIIQNLYAEEWTGLFHGLSWSSDVVTKKIRTGSFHLDDIPGVINGMIDTFLWVAWTIAVLFVIIGAYKLLFWSLKQDHTKWRETIIMALTGFAISVLAWFIVKFIFNNFG